MKEITNGNFNLQGEMRRKEMDTLQKDVPWHWFSGLVISKMFHQILLSSTLWKFQ